MCSVLLCFSVRKRTHLRVVGSHFFYAGYFFLSQSAQSSRSFLAHCFEPTEGLRHTENTERYCQRRVLGDGCWVLMIRQRGIRVNLRSHHDASSEGGVTSVITPLSNRGGVGGGAALSHVLLYFLTELHRRTDFTRFHRDIKSTDITERYNQN